MLPSVFIPWAWAIAALLIGIVEIQAPGSYLIWVACAAAITATINFLVDLSLPVQFLIFGISCFLTCLVGHFVYRQMMPSEEERELKILDSEIGQIGVVSEKFSSNSGKIQLRDSFWLASGPEDFAKNTPVIVVGSKGTVLIVDRYRPL